MLANCSNSELVAQLSGEIKVGKIKYVFLLFRVSEALESDRA